MEQDRVIVVLVLIDDSDLMISQKAVTSLIVYILFGSLIDFAIELDGDTIPGAEEVEDIHTVLMLFPKLHSIKTAVAHQLPHHFLRWRPLLPQLTNPPQQRRHRKPCAIVTLGLFNMVIGIYH